MNINLYKKDINRKLEKEKNDKDLANLYYEGKYVPTGELNLLDFFRPLPEVSNLVYGDVEKIKKLKGAQLDALIRTEINKYNLSSEQIKDFMLVPVCVEYFLKLGSKEVEKHLEDNGGEDCTKILLEKLHPNIRKGLEMEAQIFKNMEEVLMKNKN